MGRLHRVTLGEQFSEGARQLWLRLGSDSGAQSQATKLLGTQPGMVNKYLYGDRKPGRETAHRIEDVYGINSRLWDEEPAESFTPPAALDIEDDETDDGEPNGNAPAKAG